MMGCYRRNADIARWIKQDKSLLKLNGETIVSIAKILNISVDELLMDYEADGTAGYINQIELLTKQIRDMSGFETEGSFEVISGVGNTLRFICPDAVRVMKLSGQEPTTEDLGVGSIQDNKALEAEMDAFGDETRQQLQDYYDYYEQRRSPAIVTYDKDAQRTSLTVAIFRTKTLKGVPEQVEVLKAVWTDTELDTYADVIFEDFINYNRLVEDHPVSRTEFFDIFGKIMTSIRLDDRKK